MQTVQFQYRPCSERTKEDEIIEGLKRAWEDSLLWNCVFGKHIGKMWVVVTHATSFLFTLERTCCAILCCFQHKVSGRSNVISLCRGCGRRVKGLIISVFVIETGGGFGPWNPIWSLGGWSYGGSSKRSGEWSVSSEVSGGLATFLLWCVAGNTDVEENIDTWSPSKIPFSINS